VHLPMVTPVNCFSIKDCGKDECPSFGKDDPCWVTSYSFAVIKHCPKAQQGFACRECDIFGPNIEIEELGNIVESIYKVSGLVAEIKDATSKQSEGIKQVNLGLEQINQGIQSNNANAEDGAGASRHLTHQAEDLHQILAGFSLRMTSQAQALALPR